MSLRLQRVGLERVPGRVGQGPLRPRRPPATERRRRSDFIPQTPARGGRPGGGQGQDSKWRPPPQGQTRERRPTSECFRMGAWLLSAAVGDVLVQLLLRSGRAAGVGRRGKHEALPTSVRPAAAAERQERGNQWGRMANAHGGVPRGVGSAPSSALGRCDYKRLCRCPRKQLYTKETQMTTMNEKYLSQ